MPQAALIEAHTILVNRLSKKQMLYRFIFMTETTLLLPLQIPFCKIIFCKNNASSKIPEKYFYLEWGF